VSLFLDLPQKAEARIFSHPTDVRCLMPYNLTLLLPCTHPLTHLYLFRSNVLDLARDNRISILVLVLIVLFSFARSFFVILNRISPQSMLLLLVDTHSRHLRPPPVCLSYALLSPHPKIVRLFHSRFSSVVASSPRLTVTCSGANSDSPCLLPARCMNLFPSPAYYYES